MSDRGIIFSAPMVRALLEGRKTQTRRLLNPQPIEHEGMNCRRLRFVRRDGTMVGDASPDLLNDGSCPAAIFTPYAPGDRLYVREACFASEMAEDGRDGVIFLADDEFVPIANEPSAGIQWLKLFHYWQKAGERPSGLRGKSAPSIHMPRWASRLWLEVTDVRVQRVAEISEDDARAEGIQSYRPDHSVATFHHHIVPEHRNYGFINARRAFEDLWNSLHTKPGETWADNPWIVAATFTVHPGNIDRPAA